MSVSRNNEPPAAPPTGGTYPLQPSLVKHALLFGLFGPILGSLVLFLGTVTVMLVHGGQSVIADALLALKQQPLRWLLAWIASGYLYGCVPALATGACVSWFARLPFGTQRFIALTALAGWILSFLYLLIFMMFSTAIPLNEQVIGAFIAGAIGAAAALMCLAASRFLRR